MISSADFFRQTAQKHILQEFVDTATCDTKFIWNWKYQALQS